jgi:hypothetical protein
VEAVAFGTVSGLVPAGFVAPAAKDADLDRLEIKTIRTDLQTKAGADEDVVTWPVPGSATLQRVARGSIGVSTIIGDRTEAATCGPG